MNILDRHYSATMQALFRRPSNATQRAFMVAQHYMAEHAPVSAGLRPCSPPNGPTQHTTRWSVRWASGHIELVGSEEAANALARSNDAVAGIRAPLYR